jgi:site-specific recombinase XerD
VNESHPPRRRLPLEQWPEADRQLWIAALQPSARLKRGGRAGHLRPASRETHERHYGNFLGFLDRGGILRRDAPAAAHVTPENVEAYLADAKTRLSSTTLVASIWCLRRAARYMVPSLQLEWLTEIAKDLALVAYPRSKSDRWVLPERLIAAGLTLIRETEASKTMTKVSQAAQVRNGLMLVMEGFHPIRLRNLAQLEIGRSFRKIRDQWWITLSAAETKEKRADERRVDDLLVPLVDRYLEQYRPALVRPGSPPSALWLSSRHGVRLGEKYVATLIKASTLSTVGVSVSPHLFRTAVASGAAIYAGDNPHLGSAVLHHADPRQTRKHYNRATSLSAAESFRQIVRRYEK